MKIHYLILIISILFAITFFTLDQNKPLCPTGQSVVIHPDKSHTCFIPKENKWFPYDPQHIKKRI